MADAPQQTPSTETPTTPTQTPPTEALGNSPEARNPDGSLKESAPVQETKPETKPEAKPAEDEKSDAKPGAPETYAEFKAPEGYTLDEATVAKATPIFKELGLSQDQAQKLVDFYGDLSREAAEEPFKAYEATRNGWRDEVIKDATLGNGKDGLKPEVQARIQKAIDILPPADATALREALTLTGAGDHPAFIRAFNALADRLTEGSPVTGRGPSPHGQSASGQGRPTAAQALYPNLPSAR
jgi:hypothetical protein